ncbi:MAG: hypothetical protein ACI9KE_004061 [Polyangiales bacterium]|jgi:hypothetical protein
MKKNDVSRRAFIRQGTTVALAVFGATAIGCGGEAELVCDDVTGLTPAETAARSSNGYVANSPHGATKQCINCNFAQNMTPSTCGACTVIKGAIHPLGYCNLWVAKS